MTAVTLSSRPTCEPIESMSRNVKTPFASSGSEAFLSAPSITAAISVPPMSVWTVFTSRKAAFSPPSANWYCGSASSIPAACSAATIAARSGSAPFSCAGFTV